MTTEKYVLLTFPRALVDRPVISSLIREHGIEVNILQASITPEEDGRMLAIFSGERADVSAALDRLKESHVRVVLPEKNLAWDEASCTHCGACVGQCLSAAFTTDPESGRVTFDGRKCVACELCIPACGYGAIESVSRATRPAGGRS